MYTLPNRRVFAVADLPVRERDNQFFLLMRQMKFFFFYSGQKTLPLRFCWRFPSSQPHIPRDARGRIAPSRSSVLVASDRAPAFIARLTLWPARRGTRLLLRLFVGFPAGWPFFFPAGHVSFRIEHGIFLTPTVGFCCVPILRSGRIFFWRPWAPPWRCCTRALPVPVFRGAFFSSTGGPLFLPPFLFTEGASPFFRGLPIQITAVPLLYNGPFFAPADGCPLFPGNTGGGDGLGLESLGFCWRSPFFGRRFLLFPP